MRKSSGGIEMRITPAVEVSLLLVTAALDAAVIEAERDSTRPRKCTAQCLVARCGVKDSRELGFVAPHLTICCWFSTSLPMKRSFSSLIARLSLRVGEGGTSRCGAFSAACIRSTCARGIVQIGRTVLSSHGLQTTRCGALSAVFGPRVR